MAARAKRVIEADDLYRLRLPAEPQLSPDGEHVLYTEHFVVRKGEKKCSNLWRVQASGGDRRRFTVGDHSDSRPRWSPDGRRIAFLSDRDGKRSTIYTIPADGGEAERLASLQGSIGAYSWSPDGRWIACQFRPLDDAAKAREKDPKVEKLGVVARHFTRMHYKADGAGYSSPMRWGIRLVDAKSGRDRGVVEGDFDAGAPVWSPDGKKILFLASRRPDADVRPIPADLWVVPAEGGEPGLLATPPISKSSVSWSPDGRWLSWFGHEEPDEWWRDDHLWVMPADGSADPRDLMRELDACAGLDVLTDAGAGPQVNPPRWTPDSLRLRFHVGHRGRTWVYDVGVDGAEPPMPLVEAEGAVGSFTLDADNSRMTFVVGDENDPGQVEVLDFGSGRRRALTRLNGWLGRTDLADVEEIDFDGPDENRLQGWIMRPPESQRRTSHPAIIEIHGGPWAQYGRRFMHEFQLLAARGYIVAFCNPRGGRGYGSEHARAIQNDWGNRDYADVMAWADLVSDLPEVDADRMGVTGGSYGGFLTNWIIGHTDRFKAAVTQRSVSNLISFWGSSDIGWLFVRPFGGKPPWEDFENLWRQSPVRWLGQARTPTLVIHSEQDLRCDKEQGVQVYWALRSLGVDSELVLFPDEAHGLSRGGRTDRRIARLEHMQRWFDRYLAPTDG